MDPSSLDNWLDQFTRSALARDLDGHMAMISREVMVFGVPGFDMLGFDDWYQQCAHEFPQGLLSDLSYSAVNVRSTHAGQVLFKCLETVTTADNGVTSRAVEMLLQREADVWRLKQLRLLPEDEARHDGLV